MLQKALNTFRVGALHFYSLTFIFLGLKALLIKIQQRDKKKLKKTTTRSFM